MKLQIALQELEAAGKPQYRQIYARHGAREPMYGVLFSALTAMQKRIKKDHALALELWDTGNYDARNLASLIADPAAFTPEQANAWIADSYNYGLAGQVAGLVLQTPYALEKAQAWIETDAEYTERAGWLILAGLAERSDLPDAIFEPYLDLIASAIHTRKNRVRDAMNTALINFGLRPSLHERALAAAAHIGKVEVDHGKTGCITPDAAAYIHKTLAHRAKKAKR